MNAIPKPETTRLTREAAKVGKLLLEAGVMGRFGCTNCLDGRVADQLRRSASKSVSRRTPPTERQA